MDTYDTLEGVRRAIELVKSGPGAVHVSAVRLDSGDLGALARETRRRLDAAGLREIGIFASSGLDEHEIAALLAAGAPIDGFGVGTGMGVSGDAPALDIAYKLAEYGGEGRTKLSRHKPILPGRKQVFRLEENGRAAGDVIGRAGERLDGRPLVHMVMRGGRRVSAPEDIQLIRSRAAQELAQLPAHVTALERGGRPYAVTVSDALERHHARVRETVVSRRA